LRSNFGDGLIPQSETRNVFGGEALYTQSVRSCLAILAGLDFRRDAPRNLDLYHIEARNQQQLTASNNLTLSFVAPFVAVDEPVGRYFHYNLGVRQEMVWMDNQDLLAPQSSFDKPATLTLPKGTFTILPPDHWYLPTVAFSYGLGFHINDPRIGTGSATPTLLATSRAYQMVLSKVIKQTQLCLTLRCTSNAEELANGGFLQVAVSAAPTQRSPRPRSSCGRSRYSPKTSRVCGLGSGLPTTQKTGLMTQGKSASRLISTSWTFNVLWL